MKNVSYFAEKLNERFGQFNNLDFINSKVFCASRDNPLYEKIFANVQGGAKVGLQLFAWKIIQ